jgi:hypothetical protein
MHVIEVVTDPEAIARVLHRRGLGPRPPPRVRNVLGACNATIAYLLVAEPGCLEPL